MASYASILSISEWRRMETLQALFSGLGVTTRVCLLQWMELWPLPTDSNMIFCSPVRTRWTAQCRKAEASEFQVRSAQCDRGRVRERLGFPVVNPPATRETWVQSLGWEDSPGEERGYPLQYSGLENSMDCIAHGVVKSWDTTEWLSHTHTHTHIYAP